MKILSVSLKNFASIENLEFDYRTNTGLTLIQGPTGSGKSTLCDAIPWVLFGVTAKGGPVSDVLSWPGDKITNGALYLDNGIGICRTRGAKAKDNDLWFIKSSTGEKQRGKDLPDTQKLINDLLGFTAETYLAGAYYQEFSQTAQFFTTNPKNRRALCEQLVDLSLAKNLQERVKERIKDIDLKSTSLEHKEATLKVEVAFLTTTSERAAQAAQVWESKKAIKMAELTNKNQAFEANKTSKCEELAYKIIDISETIKDPFLFLRQAELAKKQIKALGDDKCPQCGAKQHNDTRNDLLQALRDIDREETLNRNLMYEKQRLNEQLENEKQTINTYAEQLEDLISEVNPHDSRGDRELAGIKTTELNKVITELQYIKNDILDLELLGDVVADFRSNLIANTINEIEGRTNILLSTYFDAEIRVVFTAQDADKLDIEITKDGNQCSFTQLSKGQRQILKLCFGAAVMKVVANHHGVNFDQVFFDESLDGLDETMKLKALNLFKSLETEHSSIFLVEHSSEIKAAIDNQYVVSLVDGRSQFEKA